MFLYEYYSHCNDSVLESFLEKYAWDINEQTYQELKQFDQGKEQHTIYYVL